MIEHTDTDHAPWTSIKSNDKKHARINAMRFFLDQFEYEGKDPSVIYPRTGPARAARPRLDQGLTNLKPEPQKAAAIGWGGAAEHAEHGVAAGQGVRQAVDLGWTDGADAYGRVRDRASLIVRHL